MLDKSNLSQEMVLKKYPRLTGHMICHSLGYLTPKSAANTLICHILQKPFYCEWYMHIASLSQGEQADLLYINRENLDKAFRNRHFHKGFMADYGLASELVKQSIKGNDPLLASWF